MRDFSPNHYERAFENWLIDNHVQYIAVDEHKKAVFNRSKIKSFDFLLYPSPRILGPLPHFAMEDTGSSEDKSRGRIFIAEVKGRVFKGATLSKLTGLECWVTIEDIEGLTNWERIFGNGHQAIFVFAYGIENIDVDFDGREFFDCEAKRYVFLCIKLDDYRRFMKRRSPKWQTVTLPADRFRRCAIGLQQLLF